MLDWHRFAAVFSAKPDYALDHKQVEAINRYRKEFGGTLFFDRVWSSVGLKQASKLYPPKSNTDLKALWQKIVDCAAPDHQKHALLYYILKSGRHIQSAGADFANQVCLPQRYQLIMTGLYELDHCQFSTALKYLTNPCITPTFPDEILLTLIRHPKCDDSLAMAYAATVRPPLQNPQVLEAYFDLLCGISVVESYKYAQKQPDAKHKYLFEKLIVSVHSETAHETRAERAVLLLGLPYTSDEEIWFEDCLLHGSASRLPGARDSVVMRRIATRRDIDGTFDRQSGAKINGLNWDDIRNSLRRTAVG